MKFRKLAWGLGLGLALSPLSAHAQDVVPVAGSKHRPTFIPVPSPESCPTPSVIPAPVPNTSPSERPSVDPSNPQTPQASASPSAAPEMTGAGETAMVAAPNMIGNLLGGIRSIRYSLFNPFALTQGDAGTSIFNSKIAENNSPLPQDRIAYRYNYFNNSNFVTGLANDFPNNQTRVFNQTREYDVHLHTFQFEKTFFNGMMSAELRLPFQTTLSNRLRIDTGTQDGFGPPPQPGIGDLTALNFRFTPDNTLGNESTQFNNMTFILKSLLYTNASDTFFFTGGLAVGIPTAPDTEVTVVNHLFRSTPTELVGGGFTTRDFKIRNETWALSPFLAFLATPTERFFVQSFAQVEFPLNSSRYTFTETAFNQSTDPNFVPIQVNGMDLPFTTSGNIREQTLLHLDLGTGYWLVKNRCNRWLTGLALIGEVHYTTTLQDADIVNLPGDNLVFTSNGVSNQVPGPIIGNTRNRVDIFDATMGMSALISDRLLITTALSLPMLQGDNRTFDWEAHLQLNYYFGGPRYREAFAPPF